MRPRLAPSRRPPHFRDVVMFINPEVLEPPTTSSSLSELSQSIDVPLKVLLSLVSHGVGRQSNRKSLSLYDLISSVEGVRLALTPDGGTPIALLRKKQKCYSLAEIANKLAKVSIFSLLSRLFSHPRNCDPTRSSRKQAKAQGSKQTQLRIHREEQPTQSQLYHQRLGATEIARKFLTAQLSCQRNRGSFKSATDVRKHFASDAPIMILLGALNDDEISAILALRAAQRNGPTICSSILPGPIPLSPFLAAFVGHLASLESLNLESGKRGSLPINPSRFYWLHRGQPRRQTGAWGLRRRDNSDRFATHSYL